jgi:hypothetical protein
MTLEFTTTALNKVRANILVTDNTASQSVKASIVTTSTYAQTPRGSVVRTRGANEISQLNDTSHIVPIYGGTSSPSQHYQAQAQSFIAAGDSLASITIRYTKSNSPTDNIIIEIVSSLGGSVLGSDTVSATSLSSAYYTHRFSSPISLTIGDTYYIQARRSGARDVTNKMYIRFYYSTTAGGNQYQHGEMFQREDNVWINEGEFDDSWDYFDWNFSMEFVDNRQYVRANVLKTNNTKVNSVKANLTKPGNVPNLVVASVTRLGIKFPQSVRANLFITPTHAQSVRASINPAFPQFVKANIQAPVPQVNSVIAQISNISTGLQWVRASIAGTIPRKTYEYRVYDGQVYKNSWKSEVLSEPRFRMVINGGPSEIVVKLDRTFDDFGEDIDVKLNNRVDVYCFDRDAPNGILLYKGFISGYRPILEGNDEIIEITILSYMAETSGIMLREGNGNTQYSMTSVDPSLIMKNVIDRYRAYGGSADYTDDSIDDTGNTVTYAFETNSIKEAIDKVIELSPEGWYYYLDADGYFYLKAKPTTSTHVFRVGRETQSLETYRLMEDIINEVFFVGGGEPQMFRYYTNTGSIDAYGRRMTKKIDQRVTNTATADIMANKIINSKKDPEVRTRITVNDNNGANGEHGYDIESIKPGDTFELRNLAQGVKTVTLWDVHEWDVDVWDQTLAYLATSAVQILSIDYSPDQVTLEASSRIPEITKRIEDINRNAEQAVLVNNPTAPTDG